MTEYSVEKFYGEYAIKQEDNIIAVLDSGTNARKVCDLLNEQDERIETLKEDVEIILDYVLHKGKFAMSVKEQKAHNRLRAFVKGDME